MNFRAEWPYMAGAAITVGVLGLIVTRRDPLGSGLFLPGPVGPRPPDAPAAVLRWIELDEKLVIGASPKSFTVPAPLRLFTGDRYRACIDVPFGLGWAVSMRKIIDGATEMGFREVTAVEDRPAGWHAGGACDYFVEGVWSLEDRLIERHRAIKGAWRLSRA